MDLTSSNVAISKSLLEARGTGASHQGVVLLRIPLPRLYKNASIGSKRLNVQCGEGTKPHVRWHGVLGALAGFEVWANDSEVNVAIIV